ncbi:XRE family transcriptional regulator [Streptomyces sp. NPDC002668]|uniref:XRE family transcriptional regulator n=1 Tax=Streptomyces sp. NPDC002668 TaxID=3154422 RepID=UPI0033265D00
MATRPPLPIPELHAQKITLTAAANHFGVWPTVIYNIERGLRRDDTFADAYRSWLAAA